MISRIARSIRWRSISRSKSAAVRHPTAAKPSRTSKPVTSDRISASSSTTAMKLSSMPALCREPPIGGSARARLLHFVTLRHRAAARGLRRSATRRSTGKTRLRPRSVLMYRKILSLGIATIAIAAVAPAEAGTRGRSVSVQGSGGHGFVTNRSASASNGSYSGGRTTMLNNGTSFGHSTTATNNGDGSTSFTTTRTGIDGQTGSISGTVTRPPR
jgi:hypothetical protein